MSDSKKIRFSDLTPEQQEAVRRLREQKARQAAQAQTLAETGGSAGAKAEPQSGFASVLERKEKNEKTKGRKVNPYLNAQTSFRDMYSKLRFQNLLFLVTNIVSLIIVLCCVGYLISDASRSKFIPYAFAVDQHGVARGMGPAQQVTIDNEQVRMSLITDFIISARSVTLDLNLLRRYTNKVYAFLRDADPARQKMTEYYTAESTSPFKRAEKVLVDIQITSVIAPTPNTIEVTWIETTRDRKGIKVEPDQPMRAVVTYIQDAPSADMDAMLLNPYGIYVTDFSWGKVRG